MPANVAAILAPGGIKTPYGATSVSDISGGTCQTLTEQGTGQLAMLIEPDADRISLPYLADPEITLSQYASCALQQ